MNIERSVGVEKRWLEQSKISKNGEKGKKLAILSERPF